MHTFANCLANEKSPYLLQHAHNPVDWYPWGVDAFEKAKREGKPIFLSIGYATCHWCHVMERESFENIEIATLMNEAFVSIKVDREERPDIDNIYMTVCQMMTGQGGWPLTIIMTPDMKPFHAATYIPPDSRFGRLGMRQLIPRIVDAWINRRDDVQETAEKITQVLAAQNSPSAGTKLNAKILDAGYLDLMKQYDANRGGFGQQPKFPTPHRLVFLLRHGTPEGIQAVEHTLQEMRKGGIYDHIGFGFHRYATDNDWLVPHFEKMLYDQALLVLAYTEAYDLTRNPLYRRVAEEILTYVLRDMTSPDGGFYSAEDADSEGKEGLFYVWDAAEMKSILGADFVFAARHWNIIDTGNFRDEASGRISGRNIPHLKAFPGREAGEKLEMLRNKLFAARNRRVHPLKDTKILADWNGLMIAAFARAGRVLDDGRYRDAAQRAWDFMEAQMFRDNGELWHRYKDGHVAVAGQLEDYAFVIQGLLELYDATLQVRYLGRALELNDILSVAFADAEGGGYFMTSSTDEELIVRPKSIYDGAIPSGNSVQMQNLLRLARLTSRFELEQQAADTGRAFGGMIHRSPSAFCEALIAFQYGAVKSVEIVVVGEREKPETREILNYINGVYHPQTTVLFKEVSDAGLLEQIAPFVRNYSMMDGKTTVYICRSFMCEQPITTLESLKECFPPRK